MRPPWVQQSSPRWARVAMGTWWKPPTPWCEWSAVSSPIACGTMLTGRSIKPTRKPIRLLPTSSTARRGPAADPEEERIMLKNIDPLLNADLLQILAAMGHGDDLALVDRNFPAAANARRLIRLDGTDIIKAGRAILSVYPLDSFVDHPAKRMQMV